ncbi:hypothetical protein AOLI_G00150260 [Acnodon oligacanthus]
MEGGGHMLPLESWLERTCTHGPAGGQEDGLAAGGSGPLPGPPSALISPVPQPEPTPNTPHNHAPRQGGPKRENDVPSRTTTNLTQITLSHDSIPQTLTPRLQP